MIPNNKYDNSKFNNLDDSYYGKILYRNPVSFYQNNKVIQITLIVLLIILSIMVCLISFIFIKLNLCLILIIIITGVILILSCMKILYDPTEKFKIYEKGIRFTDERNPFLYFNEIDHIELLRTLKHYQPYMLIKKKSGEEYTIAGATIFVLDEIPYNYSSVLKIIIKKIKEINKDADESQLIRDIDKVKWSNDAKQEIKKSFFNVHFDFSKRRLNNKIVKEGRYLVKLDDVLRYKNRKKTIKT